jgi:excisionase family DNA binding protein
MKKAYTTREAAKKLGRSRDTLQRHISAGTIKAPRLLTLGPLQVRLWNDRDIQRARKVLAGIRPGPKKKVQKAGRKF